jgi:hypothetical protein
MAKEKIEDLSTKILLRRKRIVFVLTISFIILMIVNLVFIGMAVGNENREMDFTYFLPFFLFVGIILPMNLGVAKINKELIRRKD